MNRIACVSVWIAVSALACAPVQVTTEVEPNANLSAYATYYQAPPPQDTGTPDERRYTAELAKRHQTQIAAQLQSKGYRRGAENETDLMVRFLLSGEEDVRFVNAADPDTDHRVPKKFSENTLVISLIDTKTGSRVWRGRGDVEIMISGALLSPSKERAIVRVVRKVLAELPGAS